MTKYRKLKRRISQFQNKYKFLNESGFKIRLVYTLDFIGICRTFENNKKYIDLSAHYFLVNPLSFLDFVIKHEIVHALDYVIHDGFRLDINNNVIEHDTYYKKLLDGLHFKYAETAWNNLNRNFKTKPINKIKVFK